jgi:hypothetical protein
MGIFSSLFGAGRRSDRDRSTPPAEAAAAREARIRYWTYWLWCWGREAGAGGGSEDDIFEPFLVERMKASDPDVGELLPTVLRHLADKQRRAPAELIAQFNRRTGLNVG